MKKGFTMIELIFVIVILGILAAVAVPRLAATRDDARLAAIKTDIGTFINAIPSWYQGQRDARIAQAVNIDTNQWVKSTTNSEESYTLSIDGVECVSIGVWDINMTTGAPAPTANDIAKNGEDINSTNGRWSGTFDPVLRILKGNRLGSYTTTNAVCDTLWNDMGVVEANITMAGNRVQW
jgi:general secretion pathway protein G